MRLRGHFLSGSCVLGFLTLCSSCSRLATPPEGATEDFTRATQASQANRERPLTRGESRAIFGYDTYPDFVAYDARYPQRHRQYAAELTTLQNELARQARQGRETAYSRQVFLEARWLVYYAAQPDRIQQRLADLRAILRQPADPADSREQVPQDGTFDHGSQAWFLKVDSSCEELEELEAQGKRPRYPLRFLDKINSPEKLRGYLDSVLISDVRATGEDKSYELNIGGTDLIRFITGEIPSDYAFHPKLKEALFDYLNNRWQDPETGFFGGWYKTKAGIRKTANLSVTFHIVAYCHGKVPRWPQIIRTTLAMKDLEFPYGWREEGRMSNHHNFDVVKLFRYGWREMDRQQRDEARSAMHQMLDFCLKETLNADGSFKMMDEDTVGSSFSLPVALLKEMGYFDRRRRFWTKEDFPEAPEIARRIAARIRAMKLTDPESQKALRIVEGRE